MANGRGLRKVRNLRVRNFRRYGKFVGKGAEAGTQDKGNLGAQFCLRKNEVSRFARAFELTIPQTAG
jgi:hypothetical protein